MGNFPDWYRGIGVLGLALLLGFGGVSKAGAQTAPGAATQCDPRKVITHRDELGLIASDLAKLPPARQKVTRYLTMAHLANSCTREKSFSVYRQAAIKLINSVSRSPRLVRLETVDPDQAILRINIDDLGWTPADWDLIIAAYPYNPLTQPSQLQAAAGTALPYVRADWFVFVASRPGLYEKLLKLPSTLQTLAREQGVDIEDNIRTFTAQRIGFLKSGVSQYNRIIERHPSKHGYLWTTYDFAGSAGRRSIFDFPLGPGGADGFQHDSSLTIFSLPNGFQGYYVSNSRGDRLARAATSIVRDIDNPRDPAVSLGISCMRCHDQGIRKAKDDLRDSVSGPPFSREVTAAVQRLYPVSDQMDEGLTRDAKRFTDAMRSAGLDPTLKLNGVEMIFALSQAYEEDLGPDKVAAEIGVTKEDFVKAASQIDPKFAHVIRLLMRTGLPRDRFEAVFPALAAAVASKKAEAGAPSPAPEFSRRVALVIGNGDYANTSKLTNPTNDATDIAAALRNLGFDVIVGLNLDRRGMDDTIREFGRKLERADLALFFYAGHGMQVNGRNYLVPTDAKIERLSSLSLDTVDVSTVLAQMEEEKRVNLLFLDACRHNPLAAYLSKVLGARSGSIGNGLAPIQSAVGTLIAYATQPDNFAADGEGRNSPFTAALLKHIGTRGADISAIMRRVRSDVVAATREKQVPWDHSSLMGDVILAR